MLCSMCFHENFFFFFRVLSIVYFAAILLKDVLTYSRFMTVRETRSAVCAYQRLLQVVITIFPSMRRRIIRTGIGLPPRTGLRGNLIWPVSAKNRRPYCVSWNSHVTFAMIAMFPPCCQIIMTHFSRYHTTYNKCNARELVFKAKSKLYTCISSSTKLVSASGTEPKHFVYHSSFDVVGVRRYSRGTLHHWQVRA